MPEDSGLDARDTRTSQTADDLNEYRDNASHVPATSGATLLPRPVASLVSFFAQSTSLSLRLGTYVGGAAIGGARVTTLTGLELSRAVIEGVLSRAGREVTGRSNTEYARVEAESLLERSLATLHSTITSASFFASASFHFSEAALSSISNLSQSLLSTLDAILGSTESSRAIAAIITLIRREFAKNETGKDVDKVGVGDLLVGCIGFALLQRWGRRNSERELRESEGEVTIWDVVILDNGVRADVIGTQTTEYAKNVSNDLDDSARPASFLSPGADEETFNAMERANSATPGASPHLALPAGDQHQLSDEDIRLYIMRQLPQGSRASIRTETMTTRTITVDIFDDDVAEIAAPPGTMIVEERFHNDQSSVGTQRLPKHTVVFRTAFNQSQSADLRPERFSDRPDAPEETKTDASVEEIYDIESLAITDSPSRIKSYSDESTANDNTTASMSSPRESIDRHRHKIRRIKSPDGTSVSANTSKSVQRKRPRRVLSSSSLSGSEMPKSTFGKTSFAKIAQKVKSAPGERSDSHRRSSLKKGSKKSHDTNASITLSKANKGLKEAASNRDTTTTQSSSTKPTAKAKQTTTPRHPGHRGGSTPSPTASREHPRDLPNRAPSRTDYFSVKERSRESFVSQTDTYSLRSVEARPGSASYTRTHYRSNSSMSRTRSEDITVSLNGDGPPGSPSTYRRSRLFAPSIYSLATGSETSLVLAPRPRKSVYEDQSTIISLNRNGRVPGIFPDNHLVNNIRRFCRFSSASYGSNALKVMGVPHTTKAIQFYDPDNHEHSSFSNLTGLPPSTILLSSYLDPAGGSNAAGETATGFPLVHYLFLDHESKAIVLALRGTWGFEDILTDMTCDYDDLEWQGKNWKVHKGMHASARRLLEGGGGKVMATIRAALEEFPEYGVIFCGHSLGGGVAALLATMISEPNSDPSGPSFVTASTLTAARPLLLTANHQEQAARTFSLPSGRPIHVYAYGPPAVMSPFLRRATRGLITTVVNGKDIVPSLSLGTLHDFRAVALAFKNDTTGSKSHIRSRVWEGLRQSILNKFYINQPPMLVNAGEGLGEDSWAWSALKSLREEMIAPKLMPPGEVFVVETMRVLQRNAFTPDTTGDGYPQLGRPATRVQLKFIRNVESWFGELRFSSGMLADHNPARYEASLAALTQGVLDD
ncbi:hypothetical protein VTN77DRAFT_5951 [Rasamsonia byssochlamydoides]|uniref:uncharacterized protein n=1 Tax=Rasamsonia byssochlamydoides TaxID=89139 RepID=UPI003742CCCF